MDHITRRPFAHFLIKRSFQLKMISKVLLVMGIAGVITSLLLARHYTSKSIAGSFFYMSNDLRQDLELTGFMGIIMPPIMLTQCISIIVAFAIGLFSSRKAAVPIYKIEQWAKELEKGNLNATLSFREKKEMEELTEACNNAIKGYRILFNDISQITKELESIEGVPSRVRSGINAIKANLDKIVF